jgi:hypothetical protein
LNIHPPALPQLTGIIEKWKTTPLTMPIPLVAEAFQEGLSKLPYIYTILKTLPWIGGVYGLKSYFAGASNFSERNMHSKVVMMTVSDLYLHFYGLLIT